MKNKQEDSQLHWVNRLLEETLIDGKMEHFDNNYDFNCNPSESVVNRDEIIIAKEMIDVCWNQWLAYQENQIPAVFDGESFHGLIDDLPPSRLLEMFQDYFQGWLSVQHDDGSELSDEE